MYKFYRRMSSGFWKYTECFNSTLDPLYHEWINQCNKDEQDWKLVDHEGNIKFSRIKTTEK